MTSLIKAFFKGKELPAEIEMIILDIKYQHEQYLIQKKILLDIPLESVKMKIRYMINIYNFSLSNYQYDTIEDVILDNTTRAERANMIFQLNKCKCCRTHQIQKPSFGDYIGGFVPEYPTSVYREKPCPCFCRSMCRTICRAENDIILD
jgi:hypothetical protein